MRRLVKWIMLAVGLLVAVEIFVVNYLGSNAKLRRKNPIVNGRTLSREELIKKNEGLSISVESMLERERLEREAQATPSPPPVVKKNIIVFHVACVICGDRMSQALMLVKSILMFNTNIVKFHIFCEDVLRGNLTQTLDSWPAVKSGTAAYKLYPISFPSEENERWKKLFMPCAAQRLFLPSLLPDVDSLIYFDVDTLVLTNLKNVWRHFKEFNSTQLAGMTREGEVIALNWYHRFAKHPFYGTLGLNSGVMLMNLTRIRQNLKWQQKVLDVYKKYRYALTWGDQDILNVIFHEYPECLYLLTCDMNFRPDHCMYGSNCQTIASQGVSVMHGNRGVFRNDKHPVFKAVYESFQEFNLTYDSLLTLLHSLKKRFQTLAKSYCLEIADQMISLIDKEFTERTIHR